MSGTCVLDRLACEIGHDDVQNKVWPRFGFSSMSEAYLSWMFVTTDDARRARARAFVTLFLMLRALSSVMHGFTIFDVADILKFPTQVLLPKLVIYSLDSHTSTEQIIINPNVNLSQISTCFRFVYFAYFRRNCSIPLVRNPCLRLEHTNLKYKTKTKKTPYVWKYMHKL